MTRLKEVPPESTDGKLKEQLDAVRGKPGKVPNMMRGMANSPAVLDAYLQFYRALTLGTLRPKVREQIASVDARGRVSDDDIAKANGNFTVMDFPTRSGNTTLQPKKSELDHITGVEINNGDKTVNHLQTNYHHIAIIYHTLIHISRFPP